MGFIQDIYLSEKELAEEKEKEKLKENPNLEQGIEEEQESNLVRRRWERPRRRW